MSEKWGIHQDFPNYKISSHGRIFNIKRNRYIKGTTHKTSKTKSPYCYTNIVNRKGIKTSKYIHRLVLETFVGNAPKGHECCHIDGDSQNNKLENLKWGTPAENALHKILHGTYVCGENANPAKFSNEDAICVRVLAKRNVPTCLISKMLGISVSHINGIINGSFYKYVKVIQAIPFSRHTPPKS